MFTCLVHFSNGLSVLFLLVSWRSLHIKGILSCEDVSRLSSVFRLLRLCCVAVFVLFLAKQRCWALGLVLSRMCLSPFAFQLPGFCSCLYLSHVQTVKNSLLVSSGFLGHFIFYV